MAQQTAVKFLRSRLIHLIDFAYIEERKKFSSIIEQAKAMEKEQIINAWIATDNELQRIAAEEYYNEKFKK